MIGIVTGASSGMGREFVLALAKNEGLEEIWVIARRTQRLEELQKELSLPLRVISADLTREESLKEYALLLRSEKPEVKILVNCAGYGKFGHTDVIPPEESQGMIDLNCSALVNVTQCTLPYMARGGHIVQLGSLSAFQPVPYLTVYAATKAFVLSYSRGLNAELRGRGVHVMAVCPGWVETEFFSRAETADDKAVTYFNKIYKASDVVATAIRDMHRGKQVSVHGFRIRCQVLLVKLLPHSLVMKIWLRQQGHAGNEK